MAGGDRIVSRFSFRMRQLKRKLRRWRRPLWTLGSFLFIIGLLAAGMMLTDEVKQWSSPSETVPTLSPVTGTNKSNAMEVPKSSVQSTKEHVAQLFKTRTEKLQVVHRKQYVCGVQEQSLGTQSSDAVVKLLVEHQQWEAFMDKQQIILLERVDDLSETCKRTARMSMDKEGNLSLYDGDPKEERVIRTFFQIDIESMESALPPHVIKQIQDGIRISDMDEYNSVLSTFSDFAVEDTRKVMKPTLSP